MFHLDTSQLRKAIEAFVTYAREDAARDAAGVVLPQILATTARGESPSGQAYPAYKPQYALFRGKQGKQTDVVDLRMSGEMLDGLHFDDQFKAIVPTDDAVPRAKGHQFGYAPSGLPQREFLGASDATLAETSRLLAEKAREKVMASV